MAALRLLLSARYHRPRPVRRYIRLSEVASRKIICLIKTNTTGLKSLTVGIATWNPEVRQTEDPPRRGLAHPGVCVSLYQQQQQQQQYVVVGERRDAQNNRVTHNTTYITRHLSPCVMVNSPACLFTAQDQTRSNRVRTKMIYLN